jgi:DtxR family Mn-dependent transcriptional regulator
MPREEPVTSARVEPSIRTLRAYGIAWRTIPRPSHAAAESIAYALAVSEEHATEAEEEYLQSLFWLHEAGLPMTGANLARAMQLSAPTVHEMIVRLERDGYVERDADKTIRFTEEGRQHAEQVVSRHRLIERFLTDVVGVPWDDVHEEAEHLEHAMSPRFEAYVRSAVGDAKTCPHGHPIVPGQRVKGVPLADVQPGAEVTILRFENEAEDLLHYLKASGLEPGLVGVVERADDDEVVVGADGRTCEVTASVAETVSVLADPSPPPRTALPEQLVLAKDRYGR